MNAASHNGRLYQVLVEKDAEFKPSQYNNFFDSLYALYNARRPYQWVSIEFWSTHKGIGLYTWLSGGVSQDFMQSAINAVHPSAEIVAIEDSMESAISPSRLEKQKLSCAELELDSHYMFNLMQSSGASTGADVIASLCAAMQNLGDHDEVTVQFLLRPVHYRVVNIANAHFQIYKKLGKRPSKLHGPYAHWNAYVEIPKAFLGATRYALLGAAGARQRSENISSIQKKLESGAFFDLTVRILTSSPSGKTASNRLTTVISAFAPVTDKNRFRPHYIRDHARFVRYFAQRRVDTYPGENLVTPEELASLLHFPSKDIPGVIRLRSKKLAVPDGVIQYNTIDQAWKDGAIVFGVSNYRGRVKYLAFKDIRMLMQHLYCIGATGSGKSYFLTFLALQIVRHAGLTFFDVKGDIIDFFLEYLPESESNRVVYIDLQENEWFIPFNVLKQPGMSVYNLSTMIVDVFIKVFSGGSIKEHSQNVLRQALIAVISTDRNGSLLEVYRMFTDEAYLDQTLARLAARNEYPDVVTYWKQFKKMKPSQRKSECESILNKLQKITQNERPRYTLSQTDNALKWRRLLDGKSIVLLNMSMGQNADDILNFFGTLFTTFISKAVFSRDDIPEHKRVPHVVIWDEFERFIHEDAEMKKFLEMARSYGLGVVLAHQSVEQIPADLLGMIEDNTFSQISLNIGTGSNTKIAKMFPGVDADDLINLDAFQHEAVGRFKKLHPAPFTFNTLDVAEHFISVGEAKVREFKQDFKRRNYRHILSIKEEINERYSLVEKNLVTEESEGKSVAKGNASGRIGKGGESIGKAPAKPQIVPLQAK